MGFALRTESHYRALLNRLFASRRFGVDLGLERIGALLATLGSPELEIETRVVVGGTNGKGSASAFLEGIALGGGRLTGVFSSPHLARFAERFRIEGVAATEAQIVRASRRVSSAGGDALTFFEQCTAIAAVLFRDAGVDFGVFEVGLGGRLDSTKACRPGLVVITGVAYDHQDVLGDTLGEIAVEKLGVADSQTPVVIGRGGAEGSLEALLTAARSRALGDITVAPPSSRRSLALKGPFQQDNAEVAATAARALGFDDAAITRGLASAFLPGRFETLDVDGAEMIVDGAHNAAGAAALVAALAELPPRETILVVAVSADKDAAAILAPIVAISDAVWVSAAPSDRAMAPVALAATVRSLRADVPLRVVDLNEVADRRVNADPRLRFVAAGSLLFIGALRALVLGLARDPVALTDPSARRKDETGL